MKATWAVLVFLTMVQARASGQEQQGFNWNLKVGAFVPTASFTDTQFRGAELGSAPMVGMTVDRRIAADLAVQISVEAVVGPESSIQWSEARCQQQRLSPEDSCLYQRRGGVLGIFAGLLLDRLRLRPSFDVGLRLTYFGPDACIGIDRTCHAMREFHRPRYRFAVRPAVRFSFGLLELQVADWLSHERSRLQHELGVTARFF